MFAKLYLKIVFSLPYEGEKLHFKKANVNHIRKTISGFQWEKLFQNMNANYLTELSKTFYIVLFHIK